MNILRFGLLAVVTAGLANGCSDRRGTDERVTSKSVNGGGDGTGRSSATAGNDRRLEVHAEIWVDNWFRLAVNGEAVVEDSVAFKTERSFNAESARFSAAYPMTLAFTFRDFIENDTGLEYTGLRRQQMGDGGAIAQFTDAKTGSIIKVTDSSWRCKVIHHAPIDAACADEEKPTEGEGSCGAKILEAPASWTDRDFDDKKWVFATEHSSRQVRPKGGYDDINWNPAAKLIWSNDLERDNTVLCRTVIEGP